MGTSARGLRDDTAPLRRRGASEHQRFFTVPFIGRDKGLVPGTPCRLLAVDTVAETVTIEGPAGMLTLGLSAAKKVTVE